MKGSQKLIAVVSAVVILASLTGLYVTYDLDPQGSFARLFIDLGALIAIISACLAIPKPRSLPIYEFSDALRALSGRKYDKRLLEDYGELNEVAQAFNELAGNLSDREDSSLGPIKFRGQKATPIETQHSHHPEIGAVKAIAEGEMSKASPEPQREILQDTVIAPEPIFEIEKSLMPSQLDPIESKAPPKGGPAHPDNNLYDLFQEFLAARKNRQLPAISYDVFTQTINEAKRQISETHASKEVHFTIVEENGDIALRPHLVS